MGVKVQWDHRLFQSHGFHTHAKGCGTIPLRTALAGRGAAVGTSACPVRGGDTASVRSARAPVKAKPQVKCRLILDVVIHEGAVTLKLLAGKCESLIATGDTFFCVDSGFERIDVV